MAKRTGQAAFDIEGLDSLLCGGLPRGRVYLLKGRPGAGKTTLALQLLLSGARNGERGLYFTLSETSEELRGVATSHGWSLDGLSIFELKAPEAQHFAEDQYTMYEPSEIELNDAIRTLLAEVDRVKPDRVVFDSLSEIRLLARQPLRYRRQILALKQRFAGTQCTVLLLDDHSAEEGSEGQLESLVHGVIALERHSPLYGGARRRMEISKLRGMDYRDGFHDFDIVPGGIRVFPRLVAAEHRPTYAPECIPSGVQEFDALLGGGLDRGTATLIIGPAGSGKSAMASQYAAAFATRGERAAIFTFDENINTLFSRADALGMPLRRHADEGTVRVQQVDPAEMSPGQFANEVRSAVERDGVRLVVIDSLTGFLNAMPEEKFLLNQLHELLAYLAQCGVVTILVATQHGLIGNMVTPIDVSYLADTVVLLRYYEAGGAVRNAISVVKKRSGAHERTIREFALSARGINIGKPLAAFHGVLTGVPTYTGNVQSLLGGEDAE